MGDTVDATKAFHEVIDKKVKRVSLIDTFNDEKFEALKVARGMGKDLFAVRLDTPGSRRGDFLRIMEEVRWELDLRGFKHVKLFLSGGLDEYQILKYNAFADGYGVGTSISSAPVVDFSMDIIEIEGEPLAKRGKMSGPKKVLRCKKCLASKISPLKMAAGSCQCGGKFENILLPMISKGTLKHPLPKAEHIRNHVLKQLKNLDLEIKI
jgi:nicotinate phosphoribosyltransferase